MKKVIPYISHTEAMMALDNGGRFYNILTKAGDGVISQSELGKVGGVFNNKQAAILFLELSISKLDSNTKNSLLAKMDGDVKKRYKTLKPISLLTSQVDTKAVLASSVIVTGIPKKIGANTNFNGFISLPIITEGVTTFMMIPLIEEYDVYELRDEETLETCVIAHANSKHKLPEQKIKVAGIIKKFNSSEEVTTQTNLFLEVLYYSDTV